MHQGYIGLQQARELVAEKTPLLPPRQTPLARAAGLVAAAAIEARVWSPSVTASTKDGFALRGRELEGASARSPVCLEVVGSVAAGESPRHQVGPGQALRITTGAPLPPGADAVLASEFTRLQGDRVFCLAPAAPGRNLMAKGSDVRPGQVLARPGQVLTPAGLGLLAAGGWDQAPVYPRPRVGLLATGREVVAPGEELPAGAVYASNLVALAAWLHLQGMAWHSRVVDDDAGQIARAAEELLRDCDALLTSGGAWTSRRDLVVGVMQELGMEMFFRRVRMGPGKGVAFGLLGDKPVFCLPGGPPSNEMAFLQLALPGLWRMAGHPDPGLPLAPARLAQDLEGQADWTQLWHGGLESGSGELPRFRPFAYSGRLGAMAASQAVVSLPEGMTRLAAGSRVMVQLLPPTGLAPVVNRASGMPA